MRLTVDEGLEMIMAAVDMPELSQDEFRKVATEALQASENYGFGAGMRWQLKALLLLDQKHRDSLLMRVALEMRDWGVSR